MNGTPGPWEAAFVGFNEKKWIGIGQAGKAYPRSDKVIALCGEVGGEFETDSIADAKLIAQAPALRAVAFALVKTDEDHDCPFCSKHEWGKEHHEADCPYALAYLALDCLGLKIGGPNP